eukprot:COSAG02_NODE_46212_length_350_cov_337.760956_1_plen_64_part_01
MQFRHSGRDQLVAYESAVSGHIPPSVALKYSEVIYRVERRPAAEWQPDLAGLSIWEVPGKFLVF